MSRTSIAMRLQVWRQAEEASALRANVPTVVEIADAVGVADVLAVVVDTGTRQLML